MTVLVVNNCCHGGAPLIEEIFSKILEISVPVRTVVDIDDTDRLPDIWAFPVIIVLPTKLMLLTG